MLQTLLSARENTSWGMASHAADPALAPIDSNGNLTQKTEGTDVWAYEWNARDELTRVTKNAVEQARFAYDPKGRRVEKVAGGITTSYTYDEDSILRELRASTATKFIHGPAMDEPIASEDSQGVLTYFHADWLGSVIKITNQAGTVLNHHLYDAWGNRESGSSSAGYAFTGREWEPETGLYYYRARYYDPKAGRFVSEDPAGLEDGPNRYTYVRNKPADRIDPTGRFTQAERKYCRDPRNWKACADGTLCAGFSTVAFWGAGGDSPDNARKHCVWSCCLARTSGPTAAYDITTAHEGGPNDRCSRQMDMQNNASGIAFGLANPWTSCFTLCDPKYLQCQRKTPPCF